MLLLNNFIISEIAVDQSIKLFIKLISLVTQGSVYIIEKRNNRKEIINLVVICRNS